MDIQNENSDNATITNVTSQFIETNESDSENSVPDAKSECMSAAASENGKSTADTESKPKRSVIEIIKRYIVLCIGLFIMSFGVGLSIKATLGTSPISSIPNVLNIITGLTVGTTTIIFNVLIVLLQIVILRKRFAPIQLIQIPVCVIFGFLCDFALWCFGDLTIGVYWQQWIACGIGIILVAIGVSMEVTGGVVTLAGEGLVLALCKVTPIKFGYMKVICDSSMVLVAAILILAFHHKLEGVREGTVAAALLVGIIAKQFNRFMIPLGNLFYYGKLKVS